MSRHTARLLTGAYFVVMLVAVIWPGAVPASRVEPTVLGLPFSFFWPALWVAGAVPVLWGLDRVEGRHRPGGASMPLPPGLGTADEPSSGRAAPGDPSTDGPSASRGGD